MQKRFQALSDRQWELIKQFFATKRTRKYSLRRIWDAIRYITRCGIQWRNLPTCFPPYQTVYYYFRKWKNNGFLEELNEKINRIERRILPNRADSPSLLLVDSQSVRLAPFMDQARGLDANKKINGRKRTIITDVLGRVWRCGVHAANVADGKAGIDVIEPDLRTQMERVEKILGDNAYNGVFAERVNGEIGIIFEKSKRQEGKRGFVPEVKRWVVERSFAWMNFYRRLVKDYERTVESSEMFVYMANIEMTLTAIDQNTKLNF